MYDNIGGKIKGLAKTIFAIEAIFCVIAGIALMTSGGGSGFLIGLLVIIGGFLFSWISSWLLYGFGEIIDLLRENNRDAYYASRRRFTAQMQSETRTEQQPTKTVAPEIVPEEPIDPSVPYVCGKCGFKGPYGEKCPDCGSSIKRYNKEATQEAVQKAKEYDELKREEKFKAAAQKTVGEPIRVKVDFTGCANCPVCGRPIDCREKVNVTCRHCGCEVRTL